MAKQIVAWCDNHLAKDEQVPASTVPATLYNGMPMEVDLCEPCEKEIVEPLRLLLEEYGQPVQEGGSEQDNLLHCPLPGCTKKFTHGRNLQKHMERVHDTTLPDSVLGAELVVQKTTDTSGATVYPCPDCERTFKRPQGVSAHRFQAHGYVSPTRASRKGAKA